MTEEILSPEASALAPSVPAQTKPARARRVALLPERSDFLAGDTSAKVEAFLAQALANVTGAPESTAPAAT